MYFVAMFECCSIFILMHLVGHLLIIVDRCHICFACHFQTVHPIPVIFISISTEITSTFQWHSWISKWGQVQSFLSKSCICIAYRIPHIISCSCVVCLLRCVLISGVWFFGLVPVTSRLWGPVRLRPFFFFMDSFFFLAGFQARWSYPRNHYYLCFARCSLFCYAYATMPTTCLSCLPNCHDKPLTHP